MSIRHFVRHIALLVLAALVFVSCSASTPSLAMPGIPYAWQVPENLLKRLAAEPLTETDGEFAASIFEAGGTSAATVTYAPITGAAPSILMSVFWFPAADFDRAQNPNEPPRFGVEVLRTNGQVLAVAGPTDAMYDGEDGAAITTLYKLMYDPNNWHST